MIWYIPNISVLRKTGHVYKINYSPEKNEKPHYYCLFLKLSLEKVHIINYLNFLVVRVGLGGIMKVELLSPCQIHNKVKDTELTSGQGTNHHAPGAETSEAQLLESHLPGKIHQPGWDASGASCGLWLVDQGEQCISGVRNDSGSNTSDSTRRKSNSHLSAVGRSGEVNS